MKIKQKNIRRAYLKLCKDIEKLDNKIVKLQATCIHPNVLKLNKADTGNYDPQENRYWTEFSCPDCGKYWTEEGSK